MLQAGLLKGIERNHATRPVLMLRVTTFVNIDLYLGITSLRYIADFTHWKRSIHWPLVVQTRDQHVGYSYP